MKKIIVLLLTTAGLIIAYGTFRYGIPGYSTIFPQGGWQTDALLIAIACSIILLFAQIFKKKTV